LREFGINHPISARDLAFFANCTQDGLVDTSFDGWLKGRLTYIHTWLKEGVIYDKESPLLLVRTSPLVEIETAKKATQAHMKGEEFYVDPIRYQEQAEKDRSKSPEERKVFELSRPTEDLDIPLDRFGKDELTLWLFQDQAQAYGEILSSEGLVVALPVNLIEQDYINRQDQAFVRQVRYGWDDWGVYENSGLDLGDELCRVSENEFDAGDSQALHEYFLSTGIRQA
jgi:hypothetical protein